MNQCVCGHDYADHTSLGGCKGAICDTCRECNAPGTPVADMNPYCSLFRPVGVDEENPLRLPITARK